MRKQFLRECKGSARGTYRVSDDLREMITFRRINFNDRPWPIQAKFDFIFCRNVLIYFDRVKQEEFIRGFIEKLVPAGHLFLGHSENVMGHMSELSALGATVYQVRDSRATHVAPVATPAKPVLLPPAKTPLRTTPSRLTIGEANQALSAAIQDTFVFCLHDSEHQRTGILQWALFDRENPGVNVIKAPVLSLVRQFCATNGSVAHLTAKALTINGDAQQADTARHLTSLQQVLKDVGVDCALLQITDPDGVKMTVNCGTGLLRLASVSARKLQLRVDDRADVPDRGSHKLSPVLTNADERTTCQS